MRTEYDTMRAVKVPDSAYYGVQTQWYYKRASSGTLAAIENVHKSPVNTAATQQMVGVCRQCPLMVQSLYDYAIPSRF